MRKCSGVTILEALFTAFLLSVILSGTAFILRGYAQASVHSSTKDRVMAGANAALETVRADLSAASTLSVSSSNPRLVIQRVDPAVTTRVASVPSGGAWDPFDPDYLAEIRYEVVDEELFRTVTPPGGSPSTQLLAGNILDFQCQDFGRGRYDVTISFEETAKRTDIHSIVLRRVDQEPAL